LSRLVSVFLSHFSIELLSSSGSRRFFDLLMDGITCPRLHCKGVHAHFLEVHTGTFWLGLVQDPPPLVSGALPSTKNTSQHTNSFYRFSLLARASLVDERSGHLCRVLLDCCPFETPFTINKVLLCLRSQASHPNILQRSWTSCLAQHSFRLGVEHVQDIFV